MLLNIEIGKRITPSDISILNLSLMRDEEVPTVRWKYTTFLYLKNPETVIDLIVEMLEDIVPSGEKEFSSEQLSDIFIFATSHGAKLIGEKFDPGYKKLEIIGQWSSVIDNYIEREKDAAIYMHDLYKAEPGRAEEKMGYIRKNVELMPHWKSDTDMRYLCAISEYNYALNDARKALEVIGSTSIPKEWSRTVATILANLHVYQLMKKATEYSRQ